MKKLFLALLLLSPVAQAEVVTDTLSLLTSTAQETSEDGAIKLATSLRELRIKSFVCRASATHVAGAAATLDLKVQHCRTADASTCYDLCIFPTCGAGTCWTGDKQAQFSTSDEAIYPYFRAVSTIAGEGAKYTYSLSIDY